MDKNQSELTDKIRSAIKEKLIEINVFVDNELPDYIMILVANKRSKAHMEKDLTLFLGKDTVEFTNWLWDLVNNLKDPSKGKENVTTSKAEDDSSKKKDSHSDEDVDVLDYDLGEQEGDLYQDDENSLQSRPQASECLEEIEVSGSTSSVRPMVSNDSIINKTADKNKVNLKADSHPLQVVSKLHTSSVQTKTHSAYQYDPTKPEYSGNVSSIVRVTPRNYCRPAALQANKLLLRAVNDATKSVLNGKSLKEFYKPTPITELSSSKKENSHPSQSCNLINVKIDSKIDFNPEILKEFEESSYSENSSDSNLSAVENINYIVSRSSQNNRTIRFPSITDLNSGRTSQISSSNSQHSSSHIKVEETEHSPHFIVTLDGVDFSSLKRKYADDSEENMEIDEDGISEDDTDVVSNKKQKISERCKYWPACKNSNNCAYRHPTVPCKCFPDCKYGDKCLYIHPNCKFDALCSRKDCPFTHASKRKFPLQPIPVKSRAVKTICKFYPKCTVKSCPFVHPKLCRYGTKCRLPNCSYSHYNVPARNQMKWMANVS